MIIQEPVRKGIRKASTVASITAANTTTALYTPGTEPSGLVPNGTLRTFVVKKVLILNRNGSNAIVTIGTGNFTGSFPGWFVGTGLDREITEEEIPAVLFSAAAVVQSTVGAAATSDVLVQIEVEEYMGATPPV